MKGARSMNQIGTVAVILFVVSTLILMFTGLEK